MSKKRTILSLGLVLVVIGFAVYFLFTHHQLLNQLVAISPVTIAAVLTLYGIMLAGLSLVLSATVKLLNYRLPRPENLTVNAHMLLINFFLPGQGGPIYRGYYLSRRHRLKIKDYIYATLIYYLIYALLSILMLLVTNRPWWQTLLGLVITALAGFYTVKLISRRRQLKQGRLNLNWRTLSWLAAVTAVQAIIQIIIYGVELHAVDRNVSLGQIVTYTGAADLALFVALTPGAIGIREAFLLLSRHLSGLSNQTIIGASIIDRSVYLLFLLILAAVFLVWQFRGRVRPGQFAAQLKQAVSLGPAKADG